MLQIKTQCSKKRPIKTQRFKKATNKNTVFLVMFAVSEEASKREKSQKHRVFTCPRRRPKPKSCKSTVFCHMIHIHFSESLENYMIFPVKTSARGSRSRDVGILCFPVGKHNVLQSSNHSGKFLRLINENICFYIIWCRGSYETKFWKGWISNKVVI